MLTTTQKGAIAEAAIEQAAIRLGLYVLKPTPEGRRYDLVIDNEHRLIRVQCKWGLLDGDVIKVRTSTCRHTPHGYLRTVYSADEVDGFAIYCDALDRCFWMPVDAVAGKSYIYLRLAPARNNQRLGLNWAERYPFGAIAQLGERLAGSQKVDGSSPSSSIAEETLRPLP